VYEPLPTSFYTRTALTVARELLGCVFLRRTDHSLLAGVITEVEAYTQGDPASHSFRGQTARNEVMFRSGGCLYVYFTYGMHFCANVVTGEAGRGDAVLLRAVEPIDGIAAMRRRRGRAQHIADGPAKLCQAFGIDRAQNGISLLGPEFVIIKGLAIFPGRILRTHRIGIRAATEKKWRFVVKGGLSKEAIELHRALLL
jgi:DNA-3-methyladenine glycosylase